MGHRSAACGYGARISACSCLCLLALWHCRCAVLCVVLRLRPRTRAFAGSEPVFPHYAFDIDLNLISQSRRRRTSCVPNPSGVTAVRVVFNVPAAHQVGVFLLHNVHRSATADFVSNGTLLTVHYSPRPAQVATLTIDFSIFPSDWPRRDKFRAANLAYTETR